MNMPIPRLWVHAAFCLLLYNLFAMFRLRVGMSSLQRYAEPIASRLRETAPVKTAQCQGVF